MGLGKNIEKFINGSKNLNMALEKQRPKSDQSGLGYAISGRHRLRSHPTILYRLNMVRECHLEGTMPWWYLVQRKWLRMKPFKESFKNQVKTHGFWISMQGCLGY